MTTFIWALAGFAALHLGVSATGLRGRIVARIGAGPYLALFSLASLALLVVMINGFGQMRGDPFAALNEPLWDPPVWTRWGAYVLSALAFVLAASGLMARNPTRVGGARALADEARGIIRITRHPFMWGVALWAGAHLLVNGERFAPMLFGVLGVMALYGTRSIDRKTAARNPEAWARFAAATSNVPFAAIAQGRNRLALGELVPGVLAGLVVFALLLYFHGALFGRAAF